MAQLESKSPPSGEDQLAERDAGATRWLNDPLFQATLARVLPRHLTSDRFIGIALRQFQLIPKLKDCTPGSVLAAMIDSAQLGLEIGLGGECWLVPFRTKVTDRDGKDQYVNLAQLQIGYLGHLKLAWQSDRIESIEADVVTYDELKEGRFEYQRGTNGFLHHRPADDRILTEKTIAYAYALVWAKGAQRPVWRTIDAKQIARIRGTSQAPNSPAWTRWFDEMCLAKVLKRTLKYAPKSRELSHALAIDDEADAGVAQSFGSRVDVSRMLTPGRQLDDDHAAMQAEMERLARDGAAGDRAAGEPDQGAAEQPGTVPPSPIDKREKVPVGARRKTAPPASDEGLGFE